MRPMAEDHAVDKHQEMVEEDVEADAEHEGRPPQPSVVEPRQPQPCPAKMGQSKTERVPALAGIT